MALVVGQLLLRFLIGGVIVAAFSATGDAFSPKRFAGIFGAAPSVALATLVITYLDKRAAYAAREGRSMIVGAIALGIYAMVVARLVRARWHPVAVTGLCWLLWVGVAFAGWAAWLRQ